MKSLILILAVFFSGHVLSQELSTHIFTYILNDKKSNPKNMRLRVVTGTDTIEAIKSNGKFLLPKIDKKFSMIVFADTNEFITGEMNPDVIKCNKEITLIKVTDLSRFPKKENKYLIRNRYVKVDNPAQVERILFLILTQKDEEIDGKVFKNREMGTSKIVYRK